ncbi:transporter substrate-binding domain-containing protein [Desulfobacter sp.]|uniref:PAS domain S-box protein n=1 Tax=Desulfobacter sp. TaxID=2294 RepID=UPI000E7D9484|nr:transporter substrate-binding domain-containing protein [Desulfobacter sp.]HBT88671.1 hypothetical protein [Desulfobacter sp.]
MKVIMFCSSQTELSTPVELSRSISFYNRLLLIFSLKILIFLILISLHRTSFAGQPTQVSLTTAEKDWLKNHTADIELCYNSNLPPIEFSDDAHRFIGLGADVFALVEKKLGINVTKKRNKNWPADPKALKSSECAIVPAIVQTAKRQESLFFTKAYLKIPVVIIGPHSLGSGISIDTLTGKKIAVVRGGAAEGFLNRHPGKKLDVVPVKNVSEGLVMAAFGQVEAFVGSLAVASYHISQKGITNLKVVGTTDFFFELRIGVSKHYPLLFSSIQKAIGGISEAEVATIKQKWIVLQTPHGLSSRTTRILVSAGIFLGLLLLGLATISFFLKRRLNEKIIQLDHTMQRAVDSEARFQVLFDLLPFSCTVNDMSGRCIIANEYFCNTSQKPLEEIIGFTMEELGITVDPEAKKRIEAEIKKNGSVSSVEVDVVQNGNTYHILFSSCLIEWKNEKAILSSTVDITTRKRAEEAVKQGEENLRVTLNSIGDAVIVTDISGRITTMNPVAQQLTGWNEKEATEQPFKTVFNVVNSKSGDPVENPVQKVLSTGKIVGLANHTMLLARDGAEYQIAHSGSPIRNDHGDIKGVVLVFRDVTEEYKMWARLRQAEKMKTIGILAGGIAHDFNNILSALFGFTQLAKMEAGDNETLKKHLDSVSTAGLRARDLVSHILMFSRKSDVKRQKIFLNPIIKETLEFIRASLPSNIRIHQDLRVKRARIMGDTTQIHQVLMNLFTNAAYAMKSKGGTLEVVLDMISIDQSDTMQFNKIKPGLYYCLMISDTGCGIPHAIIDRIFEPFFTTKNREKGTGMGLSTVFGIIKEMDGGISVYSEEGIGTTFKVLIPVHEQSDRLDTTPLEIKPISGAGNILIVDDEEPIVQSSQAILSSLGYSVTGTTSSHEALEQIEKKPKFFNLVLTDMTMPEMDGLTLSRRIKAINPEIPIVLCTGFSHGLTKEKCRSVGIFNLIMKPMINGELSKTVYSALKKRSGKETSGSRSDH